MKKILLLGLLLPLCGCYQIQKIRGDLFGKYFKKDFPKYYYIHEGQFTAEEILSIQQAFQNWEPALQKITGTDFRFEALGYIEAPFNPDDRFHVVMKAPLSPKYVLAATHVMRTWPFPPGEDIVVSANHAYHTSDQWHLNGWREYFFSWCFESLVAHEIGHFLGLGHSLNPQDLMFPQNQLNCQRTPTEGDILALEHVYKTILKDHFNLHLPDDTSFSN